MSGVGKSHLSRILGRVGYHTFDIDTRIAGELASLVTPKPGELPVYTLGRWMDMPWTEGFSLREAEYLALEERVTAASLDEALASSEPTVIDTTGSVVYLSASLQARLKASGRVIYFHTPESDRVRMREQYLRDPKPVCWGGLFRRVGEETPREATERLYPELLATRDRLYRAIAEEIIEGPELRGVQAPALLARLGLSTNAR
jgi:shikimate kinase